MKAKCKQCLRDFYYDDFAIRPRKFCSKQCYIEWMPGNISKKPKSLKHRLKLSEALKGMRYFSSAYLSPNRAAKISEARMGQKLSDECKYERLMAKQRAAEYDCPHDKQTPYYSKKTKEINWAFTNNELEMMTRLDKDRSVVRWTKNHNIKLSYVYGGIEKIYVPDFLIEQSDGVITLLDCKDFDREPLRARRIIAVVEAFCKEKKWVLEFAHQPTESLKERVDENVKVP